MDRPDPQVLAKALQRYELARLKWAAAGAVLSLAIPAAAYLLGHRPDTALLLGAGLAIGVGALLWRGQGWAVAVPAGLKAGLVPLAFALGAQHIGHVCTAGGCTTLCVPACVAGGAIAGVLVALGARKSAWPRATLAGGLAVSLAIGAMGCACVGYSGMLGMLGGTLVTALGGILFVPRRA